MDYEIYPLGDQSLIIQFGDGISEETNALVHAAAEKIRQASLPGLIEIVPAFHTLTVHYQPFIVGSTFPYRKILSELHTILSNDGQTNRLKGRCIKIPVCYDEEFAPDLSFVAQLNNLRTEEVIQIHTSNSYHVYFLGFSPGFPFLGGMDNRIATPRRDTPREKIASGSIGIAGAQTGIYPIETPGGWRIIGRTPLTLFNPKKTHPTLLKPGDTILFFPITKDEFYSWEDRTWELQ
ncbi:5-oxoprolinase subunit PxpB [Bacillus sp. 31A1R]|uniref:5-oxoprolinase subunit PxpB n=1 Tax=Robertmurraya mangrovi TaxID=3098077 RepID=A0ABU5IWV2_9BACI|nr:5-oxoprolinase subunit PxpB [Bacillus sp. 31A1R]MDZ5471629.1 5-oxoprolinase subunit PxpB [Bacillus sp. 31A1R]